MTARREFGAAIALCVAGGALVLVILRQDWARVGYRAPSPLPSQSVAVTGQALLPAAGALALVALACLAAIIATRGLARRVAGLVLAGLGAWIAVLASEPLHAAAVIAAASGSATAGGFAGSVPGNSAISGNQPGGGGGLPVIGAATRVALASAPWRSAAVACAALVVAAGLITAWRGPRWPVMSARFDRPGPQASPAGPAGLASPPVRPASPPARRPAPDGEAAALWEALDHGVDLTESPQPGPDAEPVAAHGDEQ